MKIATYNMQHNKKGTSNWTQVFDLVSPDILLAQESLAPAEYPVHAGNPAWVQHVAWEWAIDRWGSAIYSVKAEPEPIALPDFQGRVVGVELRCPLSRSGTSSKLRAFSIHAPGHRGSYQRAVREILDMIDDHRDGCDVVIGGDFNLTCGERHAAEKRKTSTADRKILRRIMDDFGLINCWQTANPGQPLPQTLRWDREKTTPYHCDGIFVPEAWSTMLRSCEVLSGPEWEPISDHNPVVAEFA